jgi:hypothetical protein
LNGKQRLVLRTPGALTVHDIASNDRVLLTNDNVRKQMFAVIPEDKKECNVSWLDWSVLEALSEDGNTYLGDYRDAFWISGVLCLTAATLFIATRKTVPETPQRVAEEVA